ARRAAAADARAAAGPVRPVAVAARSLPAARAHGRPDAQLAPTELRTADARHLLGRQRTADLDQREVREDLDLSDVLPVQAALAGHGADDARRACAVGVAHPDLVRGVAALRRRRLAGAAVTAVAVLAA